MDLVLTPQGLETCPSAGAGWTKTCSHSLANENETCFHERVRAVARPDVRRPWTKTSSHSLAHESPPDVRDENGAIEQYLKRYGYDTLDGVNDLFWRTPPGKQSRRSPVLALQIDDHQELEYHTFYAVECTLTVPGVTGDLWWKAPRRLEQMREELHDPVKEGLGPDGYARFFESSHFASRGGLPGTTARLNKWCGALAACMNSRECPPWIVAHTLAFLSAPKPPAAFRCGRCSSTLQR